MNQTPAIQPLAGRATAGQRLLHGFQRSLRNKFACALFIVLGLVLVQAVMTVTGGRVSGEQFCPELFQRRFFSYHQVPWIGFQVTPLIHSNQTNDLEIYISNHRYIPLVTGGNPRWDLVKTNSMTPQETLGDAADLCVYLDQYDGQGDRKWLKWTEENPALARVLWPIIAEVAKEGLYYFCPELLQLAESATSPQTLRKQLDQMLADKYTRLADARRQLDQSTSANRLYRLALIHIANHPLARQGLAALQRAEAAAQGLESGPSPRS